jgi:chromosome segregation ATPase
MKKDAIQEYESNDTDVTYTLRMYSEDKEFISGMIKNNGVLSRDLVREFLQSYRQRELSSTNSLFSPYLKQINSSFNHGIQAVLSLINRANDEIESVQIKSKDGVQRLENDINRLTNENEKLKCEIQKLKEENYNLEKTKAECNVKFSQLQECNIKNDKLIVAFEEKISLLESSLKKFSELKDQYENLEKKLLEKEQSCTILENKLVIKEMEITHLDKKLESLKEEFDMKIKFLIQEKNLEKENVIFNLRNSYTAEIQEVKESSLIKCEGCKSKTNRPANSSKKSKCNIIPEDKVQDIQTTLF